MLVFGTWMDEVLTGTREADALEGRDGADELYGRRGADELDGGAGADLMVGGTGDDTYWVDDDGDRVRERRDQGFADLVYSSISHRLFANVENLILLGTADLSGTGNELDNILIGNEGANRLDGGAGADRLEGGAGDDTYIVEGGVRASGRDGEDVVVGGDMVVEAAGEGFDTVRIVGSAFFDMGENIERAIIVDSSVLGALGNSQDNIIIGADGDQELQGYGGDDRLLGEGGDDLVVGGDGNDRVDGGDGNDVLGGGEGDDRVIGGAGNDVIYGDEGDDRLEGGDGDDRFYGDEGVDRFFGGLGRDTYYTLDGERDLIYLDNFTVGATIATVDVFSNSDHGLDIVGLDNDVFTGLGAEGPLPVNAFRHGAATTAAHRILEINGEIYYDPDGVGGQAAVMILAGDVSLSWMSAGDFFIY